MVRGRTMWVTAVQRKVQSNPGQQEGKRETSRMDKTPNLIQLCASGGRDKYMSCHLSAEIRAQKPLPSCGEKDLTGPVATEHRWGGSIATDGAEEWPLLQRSSVTSLQCQEEWQPLRGMPPTWTQKKSCSDTTVTWARQLDVVTEESWGDLELLWKSRSSLGSSCLRFV